MKLHGAMVKVQILTIIWFSIYLQFITVVFINFFHQSGNLKSQNKLDVQNEITACLKSYAINLWLIAVTYKYAFTWQQDIMDKLPSQGN